MCFFYHYAFHPSCGGCQQLQEYQTQTVDIHLEDNKFGVDVDMDIGHLVIVRLLLQLFWTHVGVGANLKTTMDSKVIGS